MELYEEEMEDLRRGGIYQWLPQDWEAEMIFYPDDEGTGFLFVSHRRKARFRLEQGNSEKSQTGLFVFSVNSLLNG